MKGATPGQAGGWQAEQGYGCPLGASAHVSVTRGFVSGQVCGDFCPPGLGMYTETLVQREGAASFIGEVGFCDVVGREPCPGALSL